MRLKEAILTSALAVIPATVEKAQNMSLGFCKKLELRAGDPKILEAEFDPWNHGNPTYVALTI